MFTTIKTNCNEYFKCIKLTSEVILIKYSLLRFVFIQLKIECFLGTCIFQCIISWYYFNHKSEQTKQKWFSGYSSCQSLISTNVLRFFSNFVLFCNMKLMWFSFVKKAMKWKLKRKKNMVHFNQFLVLKQSLLILLCNI